MRKEQKRLELRPSGLQGMCTRQSYTGSKMGFARRELFVVQGFIQIFGAEVIESGKSFVGEIKITFF